MSEEKEMITVNAKVEITAETIEVIVKHAKEISKAQGKGAFLDPADMVGMLISSFLEDNDFASYVKEIEFGTGQ